MDWLIELIFGASPAPKDPVAVVIEFYVKNIDLLTQQRLLGLTLTKLVCSRSQLAFFGHRGSE